MTKVAGHDRHQNKNVNFIGYKFPLFIVSVRDVWMGQSKNFPGITAISFHFLMRVKIGSRSSLMRRKMYKKSSAKVIQFQIGCVNSRT
ncbi:MAG: hypothetical protein EBV97_17405 [Rhodobacteraceae bacterium]|nr:hypothetical protein [Paracoccaceae bacterium]